MKCPRCQHENQSGAKFCQECSAPLVHICSKCGEQLPKAAKFCPQCAHPVPSQPSISFRFGPPEAYTPKHLAERILLSKSALEGERKQVTVLFADLKGSMELLADRDPEEARQLLDPVLEKMIDSVHRYEGTVNQVMGDGIMALFGAPLALEDHAVRACYAALGMQSAVRSYSQQLRRSQGVEVEIRVGLNSGEVVVRSIGSDLHMDYTAVGQTTHLAARMEQLASAGTTRLTGNTLGLAEGFVKVTPLGPVPIKGLDDPIEVFELTGAGLARTRLQAAAARGLTRFVGRGGELAQMFTALERSRTGHGEVVALVGEPGVGKSRAVWEFMHSHRISGCAVLEASSVSYGKATAYRPIIDLLKAYFQIEDRDDIRRIREKVTGKLLTLDRQLESLLSPLLSLLDVPVDEMHWQQLDPAQRRLATLEACKRLVLHEAQVQPLVIIFEDLHWVDNESQAFLDSLVESVPTARILLVVNYRPEYQHRWGSKTYYTQLRIDPLTTEGAEELLHILLGDDASLSNLKRGLIERTEGNPLFLEESVRTLAESGYLKGGRGAYRVAAPSASTHVPATVQAILAARIDRLSPEHKRLLQAAAVIGKDVPYLLLQAIAELPEERLRLYLADLQGGEFLYETSLFPDLEYTFKHALTHEVAYSSLLQEKRRSMHAKILEAMEHSYAERLHERVEQLGHHAVRAECWDKATEYLRQAGVKAFERFANREAAASFEQALLAIEHLPQTPQVVEQTLDLRLALRPCLTPLADMRRLLENVRRAAPLAVSLGDQRREALLNLYQATSLNNLGFPEEGFACAMRGLAVGEALDDSLLRMSAQYFVGQSRNVRGAFSEAIEAFDREVGLPVARLIEQTGDRSGRAVVNARSAVFTFIFNVADCSAANAELGAFDVAMQRAKEAVEAAQAVSLVFLNAIAEIQPGRVHLRKGEPALAIPILERSIQLSRAADFPLAFINAAPELGYAYNLVQRPEEAVPLLERAWSVAESGGSMHWGTLSLIHLANAYSLVGQHEKARETIERTLSLVRDRTFRAREAWALYVLGNIMARNCDVNATMAQSVTRSALTLARELEMRPLYAHCELALGELAKRFSEPVQAREHFVTAAATYKDLQMPFWLEKVNVALGAGK